MALPAIYHDAYSFAVREYHVLQLSGHPSDADYRTLTNLTERHLAREYPRVSPADRRSAVSYGVAQAVNALAEGGIGGRLGALVEGADVVRDVVVEGVHAVERTVGGVLRAAERAAGSALAAIMRAVDLPSAALPTRVPINAGHAFTTLSRQLASRTPTQLVAAGRARTALRRVGR